MDHHPTPEMLEGFVLGCLSREQVRHVVAHLLHGCEDCKVKLAPHLHLLAGATLKLALLPMETVEDLPEELLEQIPEQIWEEPLLPDEAYDDPVVRAFASVAGAELDGTPQRVATGEAWTRGMILDLFASGVLEAILQGPETPLGLGLYLALQERSWSLQRDDPDQRVRLAHFAALLSARLNPRLLGVKQVADLQCRAWIELGNAYRVSDELDRAEDTLGKAAEAFLQGSQDKLLWARLFTVLGFLYADRRQLDLAARSFGIVAEVHRQHGDQHLAGRALIEQGIVVGSGGELEEAIRLLTRGLTTIDEQRDPGVIAEALEMQAWFLVDSRRCREARLAVWRLRSRQTVDEPRIRWLEGHIAEGMGDLGRAERDLTVAQEGFANANLPYQAALAGLALAVVRIRQQREEDAERAVCDAAGVILALGIPNDLLPNVLLLQTAAETHRLTLDLLRDALGALRRAERRGAS